MLTGGLQGRPSWSCRAAPAGHRPRWPNPCNSSAETKYQLGRNASSSASGPAHAWRMHLPQDENLSQDAPADTRRTAVWCRAYLFVHLVPLQHGTFPPPVCKQGRRGCPTDGECARCSNHAHSQAVGAMFRRPWTPVDFADGALPHGRVRFRQGKDG